MRQSMLNTEARLTRLVELAEAAAERQAAIQKAAEEQQRRLMFLDIHVSRMEHQAVLSLPRYASPLRLERFGRQYFSQNDEDGVLAEIFRRIGMTSKVFVEIAAGDGKQNCTILLLRQGWRGLWVECDASNLDSIRSAWPEDIAKGRLKLVGDFITRENLNSVIASGDFDDGIDLLVMDIDGNDYHMLNVMTARPRVICVEYYGREAPPSRWVMPYEVEPAMTWARPTGASLQSYEELLTAKGYSLVGTNIAGMNAFFVRSDLVEGKFEAPFTAYNHFNPPRYWYPTLNFLSAWNGPPDGKPPKE